MLDMQSISRNPASEHVTAMPTACNERATCTPLPSPRQLQRQLPLSVQARRSISAGRAAIHRILNGEDHRLLVVTGPCSIHDLAAAREYAARLRSLADALSDTLCIAMRLYVEKPRTSIGWKGLLNDPRLDGSNDLHLGLQQARQLMCEVAELGLPIATEALHPLSADYLQDLVSWSAIGARTTESQTHRELASGLPSVVGFKNATDGSVDAAIHAMRAAAQPHHCLGIDPQGRPAIIRTPGNPHSHLVLRGGNGQPNYAPPHLERCEQALRQAGLRPNIMVDCSHDNSGKDHRRQAQVLADLVTQLKGGNQSLIGVMLESHLHEGKQALRGRPEDLRYGVSVTDACIGWPETEQLLHGLRDQLRPLLPRRQRR